MTCFPAHATLQNAPRLSVCVERAERAQKLCARGHGACQRRMCRLVCPHGCRGGRCPLLPRGILKPAASGQRSRTQGPTAAHALHFHAPLAPRRGVAAPLRCKISRLDAAMGLRRTPQLCHRRSASVSRGNDSDGSREARAPVVMAAAVGTRLSRRSHLFQERCPLSSPRALYQDQAHAC